MSKTPPVRAFDLFCGAGGGSWGAYLAKTRIVGGIDRDPVACASFKKNFKGAKVWRRSAEDVSPEEVVAQIGEVDLLIASPECSNHSGAKGSVARNEESKMTAFQVLRFAKHLNPRWIIIENVISMTSWGRYDEFLDQLAESYNFRELKLNSADFGVPQSRKRLFIICDRDGVPPSAIQPTALNWRHASEVVNLNGIYPLSPLETDRRAPATLARAQRAINALGTGVPFLMVYYGTDRAGGWQRLDAPLRTVTTLDRFALVNYQDDQPVMRMLQVPELLEAMGFVPTPRGRTFKLAGTSRRDRIRLLGNAVCPPVMKAIVSSLCHS